MGREQLWVIGASEPEGSEESPEVGTRTVGTCTDMCPASEREVRERLHDLAPFEKLPGQPHRTAKHLAVKKFCRTQRHVDPKQVRPLPVLQHTMVHLLNILEADGQSLLSTYSFLCDRFRAVRQEMVMQGIGGADGIRLLLPMVRFHILSAALIPWELACGAIVKGDHEKKSVILLESSTAGQRKGHKSPSDAHLQQMSQQSSTIQFDAHLNLSFLGQCILFTLQCFSSLKTPAPLEASSNPTRCVGVKPAEQEELNMSIHELTGQVLEIHIEERGSRSEQISAGQTKGTAHGEKAMEKSHVKPCSLLASLFGPSSLQPDKSVLVEAEMWSYYVLLHLGQHPSLKFVASLPVVLASIPSRVRLSPPFRLSLDALRWYRNDNYVSFLRLARGLSSPASPLQALLLHLHSPQVLRKAVLCIHGSGMKQYPVSLAYLSTVLCIEKNVLVDLCNASGMRLSTSDAEEFLVPKEPTSVVNEVTPKSWILPPPLSARELVQNRGLGTILSDAFKS